MFSGKRASEHRFEFEGRKTAAISGSECSPMRANKQAEEAAAAALDEQLREEKDGMADMPPKISKGRYRQMDGPLAPTHRRR